MEKEKIILGKDVVLPVPEMMAVYKVEGSPIRYFLSEESVRKHLATHKQCENCGDIIEVRSYCNKCHEKRSHERYLTKPFKEWDGITPLCIHDSDTYFFDEESVQEYVEECKEEGTDVSKLRLVICSENNIPEVNEEYFCDMLPENYENGLLDWNKEFVEKLKEFNEYIKLQKPLSWSEGIYRTEYKP